MASLNDRQEMFCREYVANGAKSASAAARAAGYAEHTAHDATNWIKYNPKKPRLFKPCIAARISELMEEQRAKQEARTGRKRMTLDEIQSIREAMIRGEYTDTTVTPSGKVIEHELNSKDRMAAMKDWERLELTLAEIERRAKEASEAETVGITIDIPEEYCQ